MLSNFAVLFIKIDEKIHTFVTVAVLLLPVVDRGTDHGIYHRCGVGRYDSLCHGYL